MLPRQYDLRVTAVQDSFASASSIAYLLCYPRQSQAIPILVGAALSLIDRFVRVYGMHTKAEVEVELRQCIRNLVDRQLPGDLGTWTRDLSTAMSSPTDTCRMYAEQFRDRMSFLSTASRLVSSVPDMRAAHAALQHPNNPGIPNNVQLMRAQAVVCVMQCMVDALVLHYECTIMSSNG